jgi:small subunit ribosomal protein S2
MLTKKEKAAKMLELEKLDKAFRGLKNMRALPDMVFIVDGAYEDQVGREATKLGIPVVALLNTNGDPDLCTHYVPINTNAVNSLDYIATELKDSVKPPKTIERKAGFKRTPNNRGPVSGFKKPQ